MEGVCSYPSHFPSAYRPGFMCVSMCTSVHVHISLYVCCYVVQVLHYDNEWMYYLFRCVLCGSSVILLHAVQVCAWCSTIHIHTELEEIEEIRRWTLARREDCPCSLLSQLWPAIPSTTAVWGTGQTVQATGRSLDSY